MCGLKIVIKKNNVADNAKTVGENGKFVSITEMAVDVELFGIRRGGSLRGHEAISHFVRINIGLIFIVGLETADEGIESFGIVFRDIKFNTGGVKSKHVGKGRVDCLTDWLGKINQTLEHEFNKGKEVLLKACEKRGIRNLGKAAEIPKFFTNGKKEDKKGIGRDGKNLLKYES